MQSGRHSQRYSSVPRQIKMPAWLVWTCGEPVNKFRDLEMHFLSLWAYVTHVYKFEGR